ncbi:hydroxymethylglutaryl-CoA synthase family protein [Achromobacter denitrificans]|nr:hydroxymethylglutaryl-CoA synthase family protein [Achromobacter denitrificans]
MRGILSFGAYIPRLRLQREAILRSHSWYDASLSAHGRGERAMCNYDEDAITMAVEAARDCLAGHDAPAVDDLLLASTSLPYASRLNASIVAQALNLPEGIGALDIASSQRGATSALIQALRGGATRSALIVASDHRKSKAASAQELLYGDAAGAMLVGEGEIVAEPLALESRTIDMADHYRGAGAATDTYWEERWIREEGHTAQIPQAISAALHQAGLEAAQIDTFCVALPQKGAAQRIAKLAGIAPDRVHDTLAETVGNAGAAHPLLMLAHALHVSAPGQVLMLVAFGQGVDVLILRTTPALAALPRRAGAQGWLARGKAEDNYMKFLVFNDLLPLERGMRAENDKLTPLSVEYRNRKAVHGFIGGRCGHCGTAQWPRSDVCVNPACGATGTQEDLPFADTPARIMSYTADRLAYTPSPPACYGMVQFEGGGRLMMDFTDMDEDELAVGLALRMSFRIKANDTARGYTRYFWKATVADPLENRHGNRNS